MKTTKNILLGIALILTLLMFFQACKKNNISDLSGKYTFKSNEELSIPANNPSANLAFGIISDSRCPIGVTCVWEGVAQVVINLKTEQNEQQVDLCLGGCYAINQEKTKEVTINGVVYLFELLSLTPYPNIEPIEESPEITILIKKK